MSVLDKERIQNALLTLAKQGPYYAVSYDKDTGSATANEATNVPPASALVNEISARFGVAQTRERFERDWEEWVFSLHLAFNQEVTLEPFLQGLLADPPLVAATATQRQVRLLAQSLEIVHPPQQQSQTGTLAKILVEARLAPKV